MTENKPNVHEINRYLLRAIHCFSLSLLEICLQAPSLLDSRSYFIPYNTECEQLSLYMLSNVALDPNKYNTTHPLSAKTKQ